MSSKNLLVELFVEELPPKALKKLGEAFAQTLAHALKNAGLAPSTAAVTAYASPRRLAAHVTDVADVAADKPVMHKLMPVAVGLDANGNATPALLKKLAALGADGAAAASLRRESDGKTEVLFYDSMARGATLAEGLQKALEAALAGLPIPKMMSYQLQDGWSSVNFVRPAHKLVALHGADVVPVSILGLNAGRETQGHRFEAAVDPLVIADADSYAETLRCDGAVIASFAERRAEIARQVSAAAAKAGPDLTPVDDDALLDEVTALVERPNVLIGQFEEEFLAVPQECLILTMKANQKYFPLLDAAGKLTNRFLVVSNISPADPGAVIGGNERVVRPRLADAKFFFDQDRKKTLESRVLGLAKVVYHNRLGTQGERVERVCVIAKAIGEQLGGEGLALQAEQAALLAKADLLTDMVGEFPELQGIMGRYYALHDGLPATSPTPSRTTTSRVSPATPCRAAKWEPSSRSPTSLKRWSACSALARFPPATAIPSRCAGTRWASSACSPRTTSTCRSMRCCRLPAHRLRRSKASGRQKPRWPILSTTASRAICASMATPHRRSMPWSVSAHSAWATFPNAWPPSVLLPPCPDPRLSPPPTSGSPTS